MHHSIFGCSSGLFKTTMRGTTAATSLERQHPGEEAFAAFERERAERQVGGTSRSGAIRFVTGPSAQKLRVSSALAACGHGTASSFEAAEGRERPSCKCRYQGHIAAEGLELHDTIRDERHRGCIT